MTEVPKRERPLWCAIVVVALGLALMVSAYGPGRVVAALPFQRAPVPSEPIPLYIGGHTKKALSRAARVGMGWTSAMIEFDQLTEVIATLEQNLRAGGRSLADRGDGAPFAIQVVSMDKFGTPGFADLAGAGVTDVIVMPWMMSGLGFDAPVEDKIATMETFADKYIRG